MSNNQEIHQKLYDLRRQGRESFLELMGIDVEKVRNLEKEINSQYEELAGGIHNRLKEAGKDGVKNHKASLDRSRMVFDANIEKILEHPSGEITTVGPACWGVYPFSASPVGNGDNITINPPGSPVCTGSVTYDTATNLAHPSADAGGAGTGTINSTQVNTWFDFSFTPSMDRRYSVRPIVQMNGHWLLWTWGECGQTPEALGAGVVRVSLRVRVGQLMLWVKESTHNVIDKIHRGGTDEHTGWYYDSEVDGGAGMSVYLQGGHEVTIRVECEIYTEMANNGRAWVDMQTSPYFYFKVPEVRYGLCHLSGG